MTGPHERWDELAAGYALAALEPAEEAELLGHLEACETCRAALRDHELVAAQLASLADEPNDAPPPWNAIRAGIIGAESPRTDDVDELDERRARRSRRTLLLGAAAAVGAVVAATVTVVSVNNGTSARDEAVSACHADANCRVVELSRSSHERAVVIVRNGTARMVPTDMPAPSAGHVYALWQLPRDGKPTLLAQPVSRSDTSTARLALPYDDTAAFAISVEPAGRRATAPTTVVAVGTAAT
jgi:anti-sigma-K factor RskA